MTLQDYINLVSDSITNFAQAKISLFIPLSATLIIFLVGLVIASFLRGVWVQIIKFLDLEKTLSKNSAYSQLLKTNKNLSLTEFAGQLIWWLTILVFLLPSLKILNLSSVDLALRQFLNYLPLVALGSFYLFLGSILSWFAYLIVLALGSLTKLNGTILVARITATTIVLFGLLLALKTFGVDPELIKFSSFAAIAALALAFGLSGKDFTLDIIKKIKENFIK